MQARALVGGEVGRLTKAYITTLGFRHDRTHNAHRHRRQPITSGVVGEKPHMSEQLPDSRIRNVSPFNQVAVKLIRAHHAERHNRVTVLGRKRDEAKADHLRQKNPAEAGFI